VFDSHPLIDVDTRLSYSISFAYHNLESKIGGPRLLHLSKVVIWARFEEVGPEDTRMLEVLTFSHAKERYRPPHCCPVPIWLFLRYIVRLYTDAVEGRTCPYPDWSKGLFGLEVA